MANPTGDSTFEGFGTQALPFLRGLAENNDRDWFQAHKDVYQIELQEPLALLIQHLVAELERRKIPLTGNPKKSAFRIHRDVRFSKDKSPYKTHVSAVLSRSGAKMEPGILYLHFDPQGSFAASGFYGLEKAQLNQLRRAMIEQSTKFLCVIESLEAQGLAVEAMNPLKRMPKGMAETENEVVNALVKGRHIVCKRSLPSDLLGRVELVEHLADFAQASQCLLDFGWRILDEDPS